MNVKRTLFLAGVLSTLTACASDPVAVEVPPLYVSTIYPQTEDFLTHGTSLASLEPSSRVVIIPGIMGEVESVSVSLGDVISVGDLICVVDAEAVETQCETADDYVSRARDSIHSISEGMLVKAPVSGYVQTIDEQLNHSVSANTQLGFLSNQKEMTVDIPFLDSYVDESWIGSTATISFVDTGETMTGTVSKISGSPSSLYGNIAVNYVTITVVNPGSIQEGRQVVATVNGAYCSGEGTFERQANSPVYSGLAGTVDAIYVSIGEYVAVGTPMFRIVNPATENQLKTAENGLKDALDSQEDAYDLLADYRVQSDIAGTVSNVLVKPYDMIGQSSGVVEISTTNHMELTFHVTEAVIPYLSIGQELKITSQGKVVYGEIAEISNVATAQSGLFTVKGIVLDEDVLTGTSASVEYVDFLVKDALVVPFEAVSFVGDKSYVYVVSEETAIKTEVEVAQFTPEKIVITDGITSSAELISSWTAQLRNGISVTTTNPNESSENPIESSENPDEFSENPDESSENPDESSENPDESSENPDESSENPDESSENPDESSENPDESSEEEN